MSTTDAARESARQRNGRFGPQVRSELDPANAGLGAPETPLPTWDAALAHAEVLREQGVKVSINEHWMSIAIRGTDGELHDPDDGTPAWQGFYPDGTPEWIGYYTDGKLHDPADGTPAWQTFYPDGTPMWISHYTDGKYHDPADGTPAVQDFYPDGVTGQIIHWTNGYRHDPDDGTPALRRFYPDGTPMTIGHWTNGKLVGEESFPPPTGEA